MKKTIFNKALCLMLTFAFMLSFALPAMAANARIANVSLSKSRTVVTLNLTESVTLNEGVDLASRITIKKDGGSESALPYGSSAVIEGSTIKVTLTTALNTKNNIITILGNTFAGQSGMLTSPSFDAKGPAEIQSVSLDNSKKVITLKFDAPISSGAGNSTFGDGDLVLARGGVTFNEDIKGSQISLNNSYDEMKITLSSALTGTGSRIKICIGAISYASSGNINLEEIVSPAISAERIIPKFDPNTGFKMDTDFATLTMTFDKDIYFASSEIEKRIDEYISIDRGGQGYYSLNINDRVTISGKTLTIKLRFPVDSDHNRIKIRANTLMGVNGDYIDTDVISRSFGISDIQYAAPMYKSISYDKAKKQVSIKFDSTIYAVSISGLKGMIDISRNKGTFQPLSAYDTAEIYGKDTILITLDQGLTGDGNRFRIQSNAIKGENNNAQTVLQLTGYVDTTADSYEEFEAEFKVSDDMKTVDIVFDRYIESNYPYDTNLDYLKGEIEVQRNVGFDDLTSEDYITINGRTLRIIFSRALSQTDVIRIGKFALKDSNGAIMSNDLKVGASFSTTKDILDVDDGVTLSADKKTVTIGFTQRVYNNMTSVSSLKKMIRIAYNGVDFEELDDDVRFEFESTGIITITFPMTLSNPEAIIKILPGALQNSKGETITDEIVTNPLGRAAEDTKMTLDTDRVYLGSEDVDSDISGNRVYTMAINRNKATSAFGTMAYGATFKVEFPEYAYGATLIINGENLKQLIEKNAILNVTSGGVSHVFRAEELQFSEALAELDIDYDLAQDVTLEVGITRAGTPYTTDFASKGEQKSYSIITPATELSAIYKSVNGNYAITKHHDAVEKRFRIKSTDIQNMNLTVVRIEPSGKVNPVPTTRTSYNGNFYLVAKVKNSGVYGVISAERFFTDTPSWAETAVNILASRMILQNASNGPFRAQDAVSRAEVAEMVTRALGLLTDKSGASSFFDVSPTDWYFSSTTIAVENDLIRGYGDGTFGPERSITRQEAMTIIARVMEYLGEDQYSNMTEAEAKQVLSKFKDAGKVADWAKVNMAKCVEANVVRGDDKGYLNPNANLTRAEMSQLIYNLMVNYTLLG